MASKPSVQPGLRTRLLDGWGRGIVRHPRITLLICLLLAGVSVALAITLLELHADRSDLVSGDLDWSRRYAEYRHDFQRWDDLVLCFEGDLDDIRVDALARRVAERLDAEARVASADAGFLATEAGARMWKVAPEDEFGQRWSGSSTHARSPSSPGPAEALAHFTASLAGYEQQANVLEGLETFIRPMLDALEGRSAVFDLIAPIGETWQSLATGSGSIRTVLVHMDRTDVGGIEAVGEDLASCAASPLTSSTRLHPARSGAQPACRCSKPMRRRRPSRIPPPPRSSPSCLSPS